MEQTEPSMKREITLGQLLSVSVTLLIALITGWVTINNKVSMHDAEIKGLQLRAANAERILERIEGKIDILTIKVENKKDR